MFSCNALQKHLKYYVMFVAYHAHFIVSSNSGNKNYSHLFREFSSFNDGKSRNGLQVKISAQLTQSDSWGLLVLTTP